MSSPKINASIADHARRQAIKNGWEDITTERAEKINAAVQPTGMLAVDPGNGGLKVQQFVTKDSGGRVEFSTGMKRDVTKDKPRFDLIDPSSLTYNETMTYRHAMLMARGAEKYGERNWEKARTEEELDRFLQSAYRHFIAWYHGETDEDHAAAVLFNIRGAEMVKGRL